MMGSNYVLNKGMLVAAGGTSILTGELLMPDTGVQSAKRATTAATDILWVATEDVDVIRLNTGKVEVGCAIYGIALVRIGATVTKGARLTNNAAAVAVPVTKAIAGAQTASTFGYSLEAGVTGDIISVVLTPGAQF